MPFVSIKVDQSKLNQLVENTRKTPAKIKQNIAGALYDAAKFCRTDISRQVREQVNIKKKDVDEHIHIDRPNTNRLVAGVTLKKTDRIPLKDFGARQTKKGVTYRIAKVGYQGKNGRGSSGKRDRIPDAFGPDIPRLGGNVFRRKSGAGRLPIIKLFGPSVWGVFVMNKLRKPTAKRVTAYLMDRLSRRLTYQK